MLVAEYFYSIRQVRNSLRITKARLVAERTNAELMVAIKKEMNLGEDIFDLNEKIESIEGKIADIEAKDEAEDTD